MNKNDVGILAERQCFKHDAKNKHAKYKKGTHSMRKIVGVLVQPLASYFLPLIYMYRAFLCIHNLSLNVLRSIVTCIICTFHNLALATCDSRSLGKDMNVLWMIVLPPSTPAQTKECFIKQTVTYWPLIWQSAIKIQPFFQTQIHKCALDSCGFFHILVYKSSQRGGGYMIWKTIWVSFTRASAASPLKAEALLSPNAFYDWMLSASKVIFAYLSATYTYLIRFGQVIQCSFSLFSILSNFSY